MNLRVRLKGSGHSYKFLHTHKMFGLGHEEWENREKLCLDLRFLIKEEL